MVSWKLGCTRSRIVRKRLFGDAGSQSDVSRVLLGKEAQRMVLDIDEGSLKQGVLGLVIALVEVIRDALKLQAMRRMEGGSLTEEEMERLGQALMDLDIAIDEIKEEQGIAESVKSVRDGLDDIVDDVIDKIANPGSGVKRLNGKEHR